MKVIIVSKNQERPRTFDLSAVKCALLSAILIGIPAVAGGMLAKVFTSGAEENQGALTDALLAQAVEQQQQKIDDIKQESEEYLRAMALRLAELQARVIRIDALGERLTSVAKLDRGEFDFSQRPAVGGPESDMSDKLEVPRFRVILEQLAAQIDDREQQLTILEQLIANRQIQRDGYLAGRPIKKGWISSYYGRRTDPFNGNIAWHKGVDFAGKSGSDIVAVASGVVTWSGKRYGYGKMVEINHGNGYTSRYAHNSENKVTVGDVVKKGQVIALMGSSGRSTGPHVHFEVYKHGRAVDPATYIRRTIR